MLGIFGTDGSAAALELVDVAVDRTARSLDGSSDGRRLQGTGNDSNDAVNWTTATVVWSLFLFFLAGIFEIGGGWLIFVGVRERDRRQPTAAFLVGGSLVLIAYGFIPTLQPSSAFGRIFAVYGGFFIVLSFAWGAFVDGLKLDAGDYVGGAIAIVGVLISWFYPR